jgi:excisionase family DNA binding protein
MELKKHCIYCGKVFTAKRVSTMYCSHKCNSRHYKQKAKEEKIRKAKEADTSRLKKPKRTVYHEVNNEPVTSIKIIENKRYLSIKETHQLLSISRTTLWRLMKNRQISFIKIKGKTLFRKDDINAFISKSNVVEVFPAVDNDFKKFLYYTISEIEKLFGISSKALYMLIKRNNIKKIKQDPYVYILKKDIHNIFGKPQI